eukprot:2860403-Rhodomonas_salina.1
MKEKTAFEMMSSTAYAHTSKDTEKEAKPSEKSHTTLSEPITNSRVEDPADDDDPGNLSVHIGSLATLHLSSLLEADSDAVKHLPVSDSKLDVSAALSLCEVQRLRPRQDAAKSHDNPTQSLLTGMKTPREMTNQNHLTVVTTDTAPK